MKDFESLSGPWVGLSVQDGIRISETIKLDIRGGSFTGEGNDMDGRFVLTGTHEASSQRVVIRRIYTWTTEPSQQGAGIPYRYDGIWDGTMVTGRWCPEVDSWIGGPFEMWPAREEDLKELRIEMSELTKTT